MSRSRQHILLKALAYTVISILAINVLILLVNLLIHPPGESFSLSFNNGQFTLNEKALGYNLLDVRYWLAFSVLGMIFFFYFRGKGLDQQRD
ncbi:hypothetical protein NMK71_02885 [Weeksellaceae bacterium KMM 9713]|uniref:Uncharacterized protein n=1 Tax=Profundicola chukchiensis TaxID=2961959 RepID=A0A9X4MYR9_9FLAO|nr:hypothetical protein [Profundicola chukchiensis]MDG4945347.1 hypothetical protein [Profundicola chukchiensis]MDG4950420.1 hypothetical protein [Profundicola chukchiensis]